MADAYYILLTDKIATKINRGLNTHFNRNAESSETEVLAGSLWKVPYEEFEPNCKTVNLRSVEFDYVQLQNFPVNSPEAHLLKREHFDLLHAVPTCQDRFNTFKDKQWMAEAVHLKVGSIVCLVNLPGFVEQCIPGKVRYKGPLLNENGTWFGIELSEEFRGKGTSDGMYRRKRYFTCHMDSAVFKPISRMVFCGTPEEYHQSETHSIHPSVSMPMAALPPRPTLTLGERVVWISDNGPEKAIVKWIGILQDARDPVEWMIGVEFEKAVGTGTGKYKDQQLFKARQGHASLVPGIGLIREADMYDFYPPDATSEFPEEDFPPPSPPPPSPPLPPPPPPEPQTIPREPSEDDAGRSYKPTFDSPVTSPLSKPLTAGTDWLDKQDACSVEMRYAPQYFGVGSSALVTNRSESNQSIGQQLNNTQSHLSRFNQHAQGDHFNTVHHSNPSQQPQSSAQLDNRLAATTERPAVHQKYQGSRYPQHIGHAEFTNIPPERPDKPPGDRDTAMGIYDQHPYENIEGQGPQPAEVGDGIYEATSFQHGNQQHQNGQAKFMSSENLRTLPTDIGRGRPAGLGSADDLDAAKPTRFPPSYGTLEPRGFDAENNRETTQQRRANFQHSNTDPQKFSQASDDFVLISADANTVERIPVAENFSFSDQQVHATMPLPHHHPHPQYNTHQPSLDYRNLTQNRNRNSAKAKSVDDILSTGNKGTKSGEHEPCPRYAGKSVFYQPVARNDENITQEYRNLFGDDTMSAKTSTAATSPLSENHSVGISRKNEDVDSGLSLHNTSTATSESHELRREGYNSATFRVNDSLRSARSQTGSMSTTPHEKKVPVEMTPAMANTDLDVGSTVEVVGNPENFRYGVIRWLGYMGDKNKPLVGLEMEMENNSCTDGTFGEFRLFKCPPRKAFFVFLNKVRKDGRFQENPDFVERRLSQAFGSLECPDIAGDVLPPNLGVNVNTFLGKNKGVQGLNNSCYMDATLFSMFAFSTVFDSLLRPQTGSATIKDKVQLALREGIVNPLRRQFYVRADKIMNLRVLLDEHSKVQGLTDAEKDPEEFLNTLFQDILKVEPFIRLSSGLNSYLYQMILERDDQIVLPTTQQLLGLSFLQSNLKLTECPKVLILQMPRCGKQFKMYKRIVPSLTLDITDILDQAPRECTICSNLATHECRDCFKHFGDGSLLDITFCDECLAKSHCHAKRSSHQPTPLHIPPAVLARYSPQTDNAAARGSDSLPRVTMELFAVICIATSHYVSVVRAGADVHSPWLFFDSMADRMGETHGYNVPAVKPCRELPDSLMERHRDRIIACKDDRDMSEHLKRVLCDGYICMYEYKDTGAATTDNNR